MQKGTWSKTHFGEKVIATDESGYHAIQFLLTINDKKFTIIDSIMSMFRITHYLSVSKMMAKSKH